MACFSWTAPDHGAKKPIFTFIYRRLDTVRIGHVLGNFISAIRRVLDDYSDL